MNPRPAFDAVIDPVRNLVRTWFSGNLTGAAMKAAASNVETLLPTLKPGFTVVSDFSTVTAMELESVPHLGRIMDLCRAHGIGLIIRILPEPDKDIGINILSVVHYHGSVRTVTVSTPAEAERALG
jgi:hypothetical protein